MRSQLAALPITLQVNLPLILSGVFWLAAYVIAIREGFRHKTYCIPGFAITLNITWELFFALDCPAIPPCTVATAAECLCPKITGLNKVMLWGWVGLDCLVVYQLLRWGRNQQPVPDLKRYFYPIIGSLIVFAFFLHYGFITYYHDRAGVEDAFIINLVMSISFIYLLMSRSDLKGLPISVAWLKMIGTALASLGFILLSPSPLGGHDTYLFMYLVGGASFVFDIAYIHLLNDRHKKLKQLNSAILAAAPA